MDRNTFYLLGIIALTRFAYGETVAQLKGIVSQSSYPENAYKAIDGNRDGNYFGTTTYGSCTHTATEKNPWWRLDLQDEYKIYSITIYNRGDCCSERINGAEIHIGNSLINNGNNNTRVVVISSIPAGKFQKFAFKDIMYGRYVNVIIPGKNRILTLCEVQVIGSRRSGGTVAELKGVTFQSSYPENSYKAIDGNRNGNYFSNANYGSCTHTATEKNPWWRLDLEGEYEITSITITNRGDCCSERINGAEIRVGNSLINNGNNNTRVAVISSIPAGKDKTFNFEGVSGRYVNIIIPGKNRILTLCEVQVFGSRLSETLTQITSQFKNLALAGKATQSSFVEQPYKIFHGHPYKAIDGKTTSEYSQGSCTHTETQDNPWWRLDLQDEYTVTSITITNRGDCCSERLNGAEIHIGNSLSNNGNSNPRVGVISSIPAGKSQTFTLNQVSGRYVNVIIPGKKRILTLCEVEVFGYLTSQVKNLALRGKAAQSSLAFEGHPSKAIDKNKDTNYHQGSCTHTETQKNPWWRVDLLDEFTITSITITNREDCCDWRIKGAEIHVGNSLINNGNDNPRVEVIKSIPAGKSQTFHLKKEVSGRYVNLIIPGDNQILTLCEVEVFGYHPSQVRSIAFRGTATQSSFVKQLYATHGDPSKAIDGKTTSEYSQGSCTHTETEENPWWRLDLQKEYNIYSIYITNRGDCCSERINGAEIRVGNSLINNGNDNPRVGVISSIPAGKYKSFHFKEAVSGRYINVIIPGKKRILTLCEVQVFGSPRSEGNAALKGKASQSSIYGTGYAFKAIDGNRDENYFSGSCTHTEYDLSPWWKVDLQKTHKVSSITITNRQDAVPERLNGAVIRIGDDPAHNGIQNPKCGVISSIGEKSSVTFQCNGMKGRYVTIVIPGRKEYLTLCEVEVFGAPLQ